MSEATPMQVAELAFPDAIGTTIASAHDAAKKGRMDEAVRWFDLCRTLLTTLSPAAALKKRVDANAQGRRREADKFHKAIMDRAASDPGTRVAIFADSLALPRPEEMDAFPGNLESTYPGIINARLQAAPAIKGASVWAHCERYFTTNDLIKLLIEHPESVRDAHVLVHLGLNDCAIRMYMDDQRIAVGLLPDDIANEVLAFSSKYRKALVEAFPYFSYVPIQSFTANLHRIAQMTKSLNARSLTFSTAIVVPEKFWPATPGICRNFTTYNLETMNVAHQVGAKVLDVDRLMWGRDVEISLNKDGMHLSPIGHELLASYWLKSTFNI
ncbi:MAG: SGNH/GDSL hydrolase family protein [Arenimonas sp.]|nr:SGNH/GDSL hydrolase family protein [Rhizobium sp.]MBW8446180.1 SGNH/GDSL hydrolase family protein [Arenimonas sp.]